MTKLQRSGTVAFLALTLFGCAQQQATVRTIQTTHAITLTIGMRGIDAISQVGIPCPPATLKAIDEGANVTLVYQGRSYVFSQGVLQAIH